MRMRHAAFGGVFGQANGCEKKGSSLPGWCPEKGGSQYVLPGCMGLDAQMFSAWWIRRKWSVGDIELLLPLLQWNLFDGVIGDLREAVAFHDGVEERPDGFLFALDFDFDISIHHVPYGACQILRIGGAVDKITETYTLYPALIDD